MDTFLNILQECTFPLVIKGDGREKCEYIGTTFFVGPNLLVASAHQFSNVSKKQSICVKINDEYIDIIDLELYRDDANQIDLAVFNVDYTNKKVAMLSCDEDMPSIGSNLVSWGYPIAHKKFGDSFSAVVEGLRGSGDGCLIKFKGALVSEGFSGSAVVDDACGTVCALLVISRDERIDIGGLGFPARRVMRLDPRIANAQLNIRNSWTPWHVAMEQHKKKVCGNNFWNHTLKSSHFLLFPYEKMGVSDIYIEPNWGIYQFISDDHKTSARTEPGIKLMDKMKCNLERFGFVLLVGPYGCGKSLIAKVFQKSLRDQGIDTVFMSCAEVMGNGNEFYQYIVKRYWSPNKLTLILDGFEELLSVDVDWSDRISSAFKVLIRLRKEGVRIVLLSRDVMLRNDSIVHWMAIEYECCSDIIMPDSYIVIRPFTQSQIESWMNSFYNKVQEIDNRYYPRLLLSDLKRFRGGLKKACYNPLFLYMLCRKCLDDYNNKDVNLFALYSVFVENTINGKFNDNWIEGNKVRRSVQLKLILTEYRWFLKELAWEVSNIIDNDSRLSDFSSNKLTDNSPIIAREPIDRDGAFPWTLDDNRKSCKIKDAKIADVVARFCEILDEDTANKIKERSLKPAMLSCYFLSHFDGYWWFSDNNIYQFLLAERICDVLNNASRSEEYINFSGKASTAPSVIDLIIQRISALSVEQREEIIGPMLALVNKNMTDASPSYAGKIELSWQVIFAICCIHYAKESHHQEIINFIKLLIAKTQEEEKYDCYDALRRGLIGVNINHVKFDSFSFDEFNYSRSKFSDTSFCNCTLKSPVFYKTEFREIKFNDCNFIEDTKFAECKGKILINDCYVKNIIITADSQMEIRFLNCTVHQVTVMPGRAHKYCSSKIEFNQCNVANIFVFHGHPPSFRKAPYIFILGGNTTSFRVNNSNITTNYNLNRIRTTGKCGIHYSSVV